MKPAPPVTSMLICVASWCDLVKKLGFFLLPVKQVYAKPVTVSRHPGAAYGACQPRREGARQRPLQKSRYVRGNNLAPVGSGDTVAGERGLEGA